MTLHRAARRSHLAVWQVITFIAFRSVPSAPVLLGGGLIVAGGLIVSFWKTT